MCVAAIIHSPVSLRDLENMESSNPHGGGVGWMADSRMRWHKGLKAAEIHALQESGALTYPYLLHFRWATHGEICAALTHPFPLGPAALIPQVTGEADAILIHNGTWTPAYPSKALSQLGEIIPEEVFDHLSDTAIAAFFAGYDESVLEAVRWATALARVVDGKMVITRRGTWYEREGNKFSNLTWVPYEHTNWRGGWSWDEATPTDGKKWPDKPCDTCKYYFCRCSPALREKNSVSWDDWLKQKEEESRAAKVAKCQVVKDLAVMPEDDIEEIIEEIIRDASPKRGIPDDHIMTYLDHMTDEQWGRYLDKRFPENTEDEILPEEWGDVVSEDAEVVNEYLSRVARDV